ncbi:hypothetical protein [Comamonas serinivorans]|nr:hypothetical protein [Comamonas serinivorans]
MRARATSILWAARRAGAMLAACAMGWALPDAAWADAQQTTGSPARAQLDFSLRIDKFIYLRVGSGSNPGGTDGGSGPAANATQDTVVFNVTPTVAPAPAALTNGNDLSRSWNGSSPSFSGTPTATLPVAVRSNAGPVSIAAQVSAPLSNGSHTIPMSAIGVTSSSSALPAPALPAAGTGAAVLVPTGGTGTSAAPSLLTQQTANWTFTYTHPPATPAGSYSGTVTFTATAL